MQLSGSKGRRRRSGRRHGSLVAGSARLYTYYYYSKFKRARSNSFQNRRIEKRRTPRLLSYGRPHRPTVLRPATRLRVQSSFKGPCSHPPSIVVPSEAGRSRRRRYRAVGKGGGGSGSGGDQGGKVS